MSPLIRLHALVESALNELKAIGPAEGPEARRIAALRFDLLKKADQAVVEAGLERDEMLKALKAALGELQELYIDHPVRKQIDAAIEKAELSKGGEP